jgi:hypothetical protein
VRATAGHSFREQSPQTSACAEQSLLPSRAALLNSLAIERLRAYIDSLLPHCGCRTLPASLLQMKRAKGGVTWPKTARFAKANKS